MRALKMIAAALLVVGMLVSASGADEQWTATAGGWVSGPVEYVKNIPFDAGTGSSATLHGKYLYVTGFRAFSIYDVNNAADPQHLVTQPLGVQLYNEEPDTNGKILILANDTRELEAGVSPLRLAFKGELQVWDVADKTKPVSLAKLPLPKREHMWTCVFDCDYAYGAAGAIVDLQKPGNPQIVGDWATDLGLTGRDIHAIEEVAPGLVLVGAKKVYYLDARQDPANPKIIATLSPKLTVPGGFSNPTSLPAHLEWPEETKHRFMLMSMETPLGDKCDDTSGGFRTYDTTDWEETGTFTFVDEYVFTDSKQGTYTNGRSPHHVFGCSAYGFGVPEHYSKTGQVAVSWFEDGTRLLRVDENGKISELGGFIGAGGSAALPVWRNDEIVYSIDIFRGIDVLRVKSN